MLQATEVAIRQEIEMKLYADPLSTTSRPVTFMAAHVGLALEIEPTSLMSGATRTLDFLAINPMGQVPVLVDDNFIQTESAAILRYLAEAHAPHLYPAGRQRRWLLTSSSASGSCCQ